MGLIEQKPFILLENGNYLIKEDGGRLLYERPSNFISQLDDVLTVVSTVQSDQVTTRYIPVVLGIESTQLETNVHVSIAESASIGNVLPLVTIAVGPDAVTTASGFSVPRVALSVAELSAAIAFNFNNINTSAPRITGGDSTVTIGFVSGNPHVHVAPDEVTLGLALSDAAIRAQIQNVVSVASAAGNSDLSLSPTVLATLLSSETPSTRVSAAGVSIPTNVLRTGLTATTESVVTRFVFEQVGIKPTAPNASVLIAVLQSLIDLNVDECRVYHVDRDNVYIVTSYEDREYVIRPTKDRIYIARCP